MGIYHQLDFVSVERNTHGLFELDVYQTLCISRKLGESKVLLNSS